MFFELPIRKGTLHEILLRDTVCGYLVTDSESRLRYGHAGRSRVLKAGVGKSVSFVCRGTRTETAGQTGARLRIHQYRLPPMYRITQLRVSVPDAQLFILTNHPARGKCTTSAETSFSFGNASANLWANSTIDRFRSEPAPHQAPR